MKDRQLKEELTVDQWGAWKRYVEKYSVKMVNEEWPDYDVNEFMLILDIVTKPDNHPDEKTVHGFCEPPKETNG